MDKFLKKNDFLCCNECNGNLLNLTKTKLIKSENAFETGKKMVFDGEYIESDICYDMRHYYKCLQCERINIFEILNWKGGVKTSWSLQN